MSNEHHGPPCLIATFDTITEIILMNARLVHSMTNTSTTFVNALINETRSIILGTRVCVGRKFPFDLSWICYSAFSSAKPVQNSKLWGEGGGVHKPCGPFFGLF